MLGCHGPRSPRTLDLLRIESLLRKRLIKPRPQTSTASGRLHGGNIIGPTDWAGQEQVQRFQVSVDNLLAAYVGAVLRGQTQEGRFAST